MTVHPTRTRMDAVRSAEHLDALPEGTVIAWEESGFIHAATKDGGSWYLIGGGWIRERQNILTWASPGSIRVVSVPVNALLTAVGPASRAIIRGAIDTVTGEASDD